MIIYSDVITLESEKRTPEAQDWQKILNMTAQPKKVFICQQDPIMLVDALIEQLTHDELEAFFTELAYRTKLFF